MQNDSELKDILLDKDDEAKNAKFKKILLVGAALCILFLVVVAAIKIINSPAEQASEEQRLVLPPLPDDEQTQGPQIVKLDKKGDEQFFEQLPIIPENKTQDDFDNMVKRLKDSEASKQQEQVIIDTTPVIKQVDETPQHKPIATQTPVKKADPKKSEAKKSDVKKSEPKKSDKPNVSDKNITPGAYVQAFATSKPNPDPAELRKISAKGYTYKTLRINGVTKVLIGPFGPSNLKTELANIRKSINKDAFVYRVN